MGDLLLASVLASAHGASGSTAGVVVLAVLITAAIFGLSGWHAHRWRYAEADLRTVRARRNAAAKAATLLSLTLWLGAGVAGRVIGFL